MNRKILNIFLLTICATASFVLYKNYISYIGQMEIVNDYNSGEYNLSYSIVDSLASDIPNVSVTVLPMQYLKARYLNHEKRYDEAIELLNKDVNDNPHLYTKEHELANTYIALEKFEKAYQYAKKAFYNFPNSTLHQAQYLFLSSKLYGIDSVIEIKKKKFIKKELFYENYIFYLGTISNAGDSILINEVNNALNKFPRNKKLIDLFQRANYGMERVNKSNELYNKAVNNQRDLSEEVVNDLLEASVKINPLNAEAIEDLAILNYKQNKIEKSLEYLKKFDSIKYKTKKDGKAEFYIAAIYLEKMKDSIACEYFKKSLKLGFSQSEELLSKYCYQ